MIRGWLVLAVVALGVGGRVEACSCPPPPEPAIAFKLSDAVFLAKVVEIRAIHDTITVDSARAARLYHNNPKYFVGGDVRAGRMARIHRQAILKVQKAWKGVRRGEMVTMIGGSGPDCGVAFGKHLRWLIYAHRDPSGQLGTNMCTRSKAYGELAKDEASVLNGLI